MPPKQSPADTIKTCLCVESCTSTTLNLLKDYLFPVTSSSPVNSIPHTSRLGTSKKQRNALEAMLTTADRKKLAIEVINSSMRGIPSPGAPAALQPLDESTRMNKPSKQKKTTKASLSDGKMLQSRPENRNEKTASLDSLDYLSTCCSVAISYLQSLQTIEGPENVPLQTENARLGLALKLIQAGKFKFALKELKALKRSLESIMSCTPSVESWLVQDDEPTLKKSSKASNLAIKQENLRINEAKDPETVSKILEFTTLNASSTVFPLAISCQLGVMRCLAGLKQFEVIEMMLPSFSSPCSPLVLIETLARSSKAKAAINANSLIFSLSQMIPNPASDADSLALDPIKSCNPKTSLSLQAILLESMALQRNLRESSESKPWKPWDQFSVYASAFLRRSMAADLKTRRATYACLRDHVERIRHVNGFPQEPSSGMLKILSTTAKDAALPKEAIKWTEYLINELNSLEDPANEAIMVFCQVRTFVLKLQLFRLQMSDQTIPDDAEILELEIQAKKVVSGLLDISRGRKPDLELILEELASLRRNSLGLLPGDSKKEESETKKRLRVIRNNCLKSIVVFCKKYRGMETSTAQRNRLFAILKPAIDAVLSTCWERYNTVGSESWDECDSILRDCHTAVKSIEIDSPEVKDFDSAFHIKVSQVYWQICLLYRSQPGHEGEAVRAMRRSIWAMEDRPVEENKKAFVSRKWEVLGTIFLQAREHKKAEEAFQFAITSARFEGILERLGAEATSGTSAESLFTRNDRDFASIGRILAGMVKIAMKRSDGVAAELRFDIEDYSTATKGIMLEWIYRLALDNMTDNGAIARATAERLLDLYDFEEMPIRKSRIITNLLGLEVDHPGLLNTEEVMSLGEEVLEWASTSSSHLEDDIHLAGYLNDTLARCYVGLAYFHWQYNEPRPELMMKAIELWTRIMKEGTWSTVRGRLESFASLANRLEMMADFLDMKGEAELRVETLAVLLRLRDLETPQNYEALVNVYTSIGLEYHRLGYSGKAGLNLGKANAYIKMPEATVSTATQLQWYLAYTEYLVSINNLPKGLEYLGLAGRLIDQDDELASGKKPGAKIARRVKVNRFIAYASYVAGLLAFEKGNTSESLKHSRRCVRLYKRAWAGLEALSRDGRTRQPNHDELAANMSALSISQKAQTKDSEMNEALSLPTLWPMVTSLYLGYIQMAEIYRHLGMVREALSFATFALQAAKSVNARSLIIRARVLFADLQIRSGDIEDGAKGLDKVSDSVGEGRLYIGFEIAQGNLKRLQGDFDEELQSYVRAQKAIDNLLNAQQSQVCGEISSTYDIGLADKFSEMKIKDVETTPSRPRTPTRGKGKTQRTLKSAPAKGIPKKTAAIVSAECSSLQKQRGVVNRLIAYNLALQGQCDSAMQALEDAEKLPAGFHEEISQGLVKARNLLQEALSLVSADPIFNCLQDSTISLPSIAMYADIANPAPDAPAPVKKTARKATAKKAKAFIEVLERARDCAFAVHKQAVAMGSSSTVRRATTLLAGIIVLLSAMTSSKGHGPEHPLYASYSLELQKGAVTYREKLVVEVDKLTNSIPEELQWPQIQHDYAKPQMVDLNSLEFKSFQSDYIDIIPKQWAVVSVNLSENRDELYVSRFQAGQSQLMVRLPLTRHNSRDDYQDIFEYDDGLQEFKEILTEANQSTHMAKEMVNRDDRQQWWADREALDDRMSALLANIEHVWLGGFKGIFCQYARNPALFSRFKSSFDKILSKHVPSRKKKKTGRVDVDNRILEFFTALGDPEKDDLDEALIDLIYFVIDILQFHGEGNAYDEVDVDSMVVEMKDALKAYHDEAAWHPHDMETQVDHTILVLEKSVQMFPWESMPCLRGHSVSRLPSLAALRDRILAMNKTMPDETSRPGYYANRTSGGYILNPDTDLKNTQKIFEEDLKTLPADWTSIVNRAPNETEFTEIIGKKDLFLYFGHGSGSHYIPAKLIRQLPRCAVACLMGCSSGALKDYGEFEPYGPPSNYLLAGSPAVLATLWDVTDKDIDKFAKDVLEKWGLLPTEGQVPEPTKSKNKSKSKLKKAEPKKSLVEAVAGARDQCNMRYLNGAAPVVYGIPSYIA